jgi:hypothetical protein
MYSGGRIFLFAYARKMLAQKWSKMPKPSVAKEYTKFGATFVADGKGGASLNFDDSSLRQFYLFDVLLHEVGHHVDREGKLSTPSGTRIGSPSINMLDSWRSELRDLPQSAGSGAVIG